MEKSTEDLRKVFDSFDKDGSGELDLNEVVEAAKELDQDVSIAELDSIFKKIDKNHNGKIDFDEFKTWWELSKGT